MLIGCVSFRLFNSWLGTLVEAGATTVATVMARICCSKVFLKHCVRPSDARGRRTSGGV